MAKKNRNDLADRLAYLPVRALVALTGAMPRNLRLATGGAIGRSIVRGNGRLRDRAERNLAYVFPDLSAEDRCRIAIETGDTFGRTFLEILHMRDFQKNSTILPPSGEGAQAIIEAGRNGTGAILVSGHFGQWEAARKWIRQQGIDCAGVYRPTENPYINRIYSEGLEEGGSPMFAKGPRGMRGLVSHLAKGNVVSLLVDQYDHRATSLDFVGRPAPTSLFAPQLALKYGVPLVPIFGYRLADRRTIQVETDPPIPHTTASEMMQAVNDALAARIRAHPGQYYWLHRRWSKSLPEAGAHGDPT
ncbi:lysophospholipid acyltransferase family protein [Amaricoccus macauensis]|uniref:lysophospholipid acyltransferase family protein n=1 Tax=Amaricoccus macauensis TaxID=57001 RepID=UPI003C7B171A